MPLKTGILNGMCAVSNGTRSNPLSVKLEKLISYPDLGDLGTRLVRNSMPFKV